MADAELNGVDYRARVRLSTKDGETLAAVGETCARVPVESLAPLLASRKIEPAAASGDRTVAAWADLGRPDGEDS